MCLIKTALLSKQSQFHRCQKHFTCQYLLKLILSYNIYSCNWLLSSFIKINMMNGKICIQEQEIILSVTCTRGISSTSLTTFLPNGSGKVNVLPNTSSLRGL